MITRRPTASLNRACRRLWVHEIKHDSYGLTSTAAKSLVAAHLRKLPLSTRKQHLVGLLKRRPNGMFLAPFEQGEIGPDLFRAPCDMGLEGMVSKRADRHYRAGGSKNWIKNKNREHPAYRRVREQF